VYEGRPLVGRLVKRLADKHQTNTQRYGRRPYGVGLLIVGYDNLGAHLYETDPSGNFYDYKAQSIGARSQSATTYLEKNFQSFENSSRDELIKHGLRALRECLTEKKNEKDKEPDTLDELNCSVGVVGEHEKFTILSAEELRGFLSTLDEGVAAVAPPEKMEVDG